MSLAVVIGGTRSGKSEHAERLAVLSGLPVRYVATADGGDPAMSARIATHAARRPAGWATVEAGEDLAAAFAGAAGECVLLDGLGVWIAAQLEGSNDVRARAVEAVAAARDAGAAIVVAEQAGEGLLPADDLSRRWLDLLGEVTQMFTAQAERVELVVAGQVLAIVPGSAAARPVLDDLRHHGDREVRPGDADHAVNVVAGGAPEWLRGRLRAALEDGADRYPDEGPAIAALAARHRRDPDEIVPTNGAADALWLLPAAFCPALAACIHPGFTEAEAALHAHAIPVTRVLRNPDAGFAIDPSAVPEVADLVIVGNPASPSGTLAPADELLALRRPGRVVVVDEAFMELVPGEPGSLAGHLLPDVIVIRSLTKALGIPGLRAGYAIAAPTLADRLRAVRPPWSANTLALAALQAAAEHPQELAAIASRVERDRADLHARLLRLNGVRVWPGVANFCLIDVADGARVAAALHERRIAVRLAASFPGLGPGYIRITARAAEENERVVEALAACL